MNYEFVNALLKREQEIIQNHDFLIKNYNTKKLETMVLNNVRLNFITLTS